MHMHLKVSRPLRPLAAGIAMTALAATAATAGDPAASAASAVAGAMVGTPAPDFTLTDAAGKAHALKDYAGKIVVLEWTNQGCPFVQRHYAAKTMTELAQKYASQGVVWLAVNTTSSNKPEDTAAWAKQHELSYPTLLDPTGEVGRAYGAKTTPHMFVIGKDGKVAYAGAIDDNADGKQQAPHNYVDAALSALLAGKPVEVASTKPYGCSVKYAAKAAEASQTAKSES